MRDALIHFLDRIKDYEHESGHSMHEDERDSSEIVDIHLEAVPELKNYVSISPVSDILVSSLTNKNMGLKELIEKWDGQIALHRRVVEDPLMWSKEERQKSSHQVQALCAIMADFKRLHTLGVSKI